MGGYKGVLVVADKFEAGVKVRVRKSMRKFDLDPNQKTVDLEIIRSSSYSPGYLNKQIISILWANGVDEEYILNMQTEYISEITELYKMNKVDPKYEVSCIYLIIFQNKNKFDIIFMLIIRNLK